MTVPRKRPPGPAVRDPSGPGGLHQPQVRPVEPLAGLAAPGGPHPLDRRAAVPGQPRQQQQHRPPAGPEYTDGLAAVRLIYLAFSAVFLLMRPAGLACGSKLTPNTLKWLIDSIHRAIQNDVWPLPKGARHHQTFV
eukprot:scaffold402885_cov17-Prasinocladus_malaysianus.AAC.1